MIPYYKLSTVTKMTLGLVLAMSVIFWGIGCSELVGREGPVINFTQPTGMDRFYNARVVRDFTLNVADGIEASFRRGDTEAADIVRQLRALAQSIDDAMAIFVDTPEGQGRVINAINAAAKAGRPAWYKMMSCGGIPPEVPRVPGYFETFWDIAS